MTQEFELTIEEKIRLKGLPSPADINTDDMANQWINISESNASFMRLELGNNGIGALLNDFYTFEVPGARFMPAFKTGRWDGKIRLYDYRISKLPTGLYPNLCQFAQAYGYDLTGDPKCFGPPWDIPMSDLGKFVKKLKIPYTPHEHQVKAFKHMVENQRGIILSPTSSGKSLIIYMASEWFRQSSKGTSLIIVPTVNLVNQMAKDFEEYGMTEEPFKIQGGVNKDDVPVGGTIISTWQSIFKQPKKWFDDLNITSVFVDEVHTAEAKSLQGIMDKLTETRTRFGLTGTLKDSKVSELMLESRFGPVKQFITTKDLMDKKIVSDLSIECMVLDWDAGTKKSLGFDYTYPDEIKWMVNSQTRNEFVTGLASTLKGNTLVLFNQIEHGKKLHEMIEGKIGGKYPVLYIAGETKADQREAARVTAENERCIIVASLGVFSTGVSIKNLHNLVVAHPTKSKTKILQSVGRVLRKSPDGRSAKMYDLCDDLSNKRRKNFTLKHAEQRLKYYSEELFDFSIRKIPLKSK